MELDRRFVAIILVCILVLGVALYFSLPFLRPLTVLSVSKIYVEPKGYEDSSTHEWKGSYWIILMTADMADQIATYKFDKTVSDDYQADTVEGKKLIPESEIVISIDPEQAYYLRPLEDRSGDYMVYPQTYGTWINKVLTSSIGKTSDSVPALYAPVLEFGGSWGHYSPFKITISKNGKVVGSASFNTEGGQKDISISTGEGTVLVKNLGYLGGTYGEPQLGDILVFSEQYIFESWVKPYIQYDKDARSFSNYWFGGSTDPYKGYYYVENSYGITEKEWGPVQRWSDGSPAHYIIDWMGVNSPVADDCFPGNYRADDTWNYVMKPLPADIFASKSGGNYKPSGMSLVEYLINKIGARQKKIDIWGAGASIKENKLRINVPWGALGSGSPVFTIMIPTELADTVVWQPSVANVKIKSLSWQTGGSSAQIGDRLSAVLTVKQESTVRSTALIKASVGSMANVNPESVQVTLNPQEEKTLTFEVLNLGVSKETTGKLKIVITETFAGTTTDTGELSYTLLPKGGEASILTVYTIDKETKMGVSGITVAIQFDSNSKSGVTTNGAITWNLGSYTGSATITTAETPTYKSASTVKSISMGQNSVTLELVKQGVEEKKPWWEEYWWLIFIVVVIAIILMVAVWWSKH